MANAFADLPAGYWEDGSTVTGTDLRRGNLFATTGGAAGLSARGGVRPSRGNPLGVSLPGGMFVRIQPGVAAVPTTNEGAYILAVVTATDLIVTPAHATQSRIDVIGLEVDPGSPTTWRVRMLDGAPSAGTPVAPTYAVAGAVFLPLAQISVGPSASVPGSVTDLRVYTAAAGGVVQSPGLMDLSKASRDALTDAMPVGTPVYDDTNQTFGVVHSSKRIMPIGITEPVLTQSALNTTVGGVTLFTTGGYANFPQASWTFNAPRNGWGYVGYVGDVQQVNAGWGYAQARVAVDGALIPGGGGTIAYEIPSTANRVAVWFEAPVPVWFSGGTAYSITLDINSFNSGGWRFNSILWSVMQP